MPGGRVSGLSLLVADEGVPALEEQGWGSESQGPGQLRAGDERRHRGRNTGWGGEWWRWQGSELKTG